MRINPFKNFIFILWLILCVSNVASLINYYIQTGPAAFSNYNFVFDCLLVILMIPMIIMLFTMKIRNFIILFGVYVLVEVAFGITDLSYMSQVFSLNYVFTTYSDEPKVIFYFLTNYWLYGIVIALYAAGFITALVLRLLNHRKTNFFVDRAIDFGYAVAVVNVVVTIATFMNQTEGFDFLTILLDLFTTVIFSLIYISVPRYLYRY